MDAREYGLFGGQVLKLVEVAEVLSECSTTSDATFSAAVERLSKLLISTRNGMETFFVVRALQGQLATHKETVHAAIAKALVPVAHKMMLVADEPAAPAVPAVSEPASCPTESEQPEPSASQSEAPSADATSTSVVSEEPVGGSKLPGDQALQPEGSMEPESKPTEPDQTSPVEPAGPEGVEKDHMECEVPAVPENTAQEPAPCPMECEEQAPKPAESVEPAPCSAASEETIPCPTLSSEPAQSQVPSA